MYMFIEHSFGGYFKFFFFLNMCGEVVLFCLFFVGEEGPR